MKVLSLELSSSRRSVGLAEMGSCASAREVCLEPGTDLRRTAAFSLIEQVLAPDSQRNEIGRLVIGLGPGSYTGIRVGISIAQGWAAAQQIELIGVPTVELLVEQVRRTGITGTINFAFDAQRGELYLARYRFSEQGVEQAHPLQLVSVAEATRRLSAGETVTGPDLERLLPQSTPLFPSATVLAELGRVRSHFQQPEALEPVYLRETTFVKIAPPGPTRPTLVRL
ncbi:MAG: tRNA (adenosine(37)-N6)-threonylcarbamoyltransferase complex dimerization subunit type 1 TsaB [Verrucomicrobiales bacterium]|nr:tRNA (adenosine(37)-N6)-threonylcarbamoyltransferase complex dimerization subunit type 1 TsaB [Verrucomicrobiales bacterium]